jgi:hypothetical protein
MWNSAVCSECRCSRSVGEHNGLLDGEEEEEEEGLVHGGEELVFDRCWYEVWSDRRFMVQEVVVEERGWHKHSNNNNNNMHNNNQIHNTNTALKKGGNSQAQH